MKIANVQRVLQAACVLALLALALIVWSMVHPHPIPVILAMSVGQLIGTLSFGTFLVVVAYDLRRALRIVREGRASLPPESRGKVSSK
jgi:peptidoglycan/LPS O-acetylase OafA/YrhL